MTDKTLDPCGSDSSPELGGDPRWYCISADGMATLCADEEDAKEVAAESWALYPNNGPYRATQMVEASVIAAAVAAERERWQEVAKAVIESHDAALSYVYERLRSQGVGSITIPDSAVAEIRAVNALRELVQPNTEAQRAAAGGPTGAQS